MDNFSGTDGDGALSFAEVHAMSPNLKQAQRDAMDMNGDSQLTRTDFGARMGRGVDVAETSITSCLASKADFLEGVRNSFGDTFLFGVTLITLLAHGAVKRRP